MSILLKQEVSLKYNEDKSKRCPPDFAILFRLPVTFWYILFILYGENVNPLVPK